MPEVLKKPSVSVNNNGFLWPGITLRLRNHPQLVARCDSIEFNNISNGYRNNGEVAPRPGLRFVSCASVHHR